MLVNGGTSTMFDPGAFAAGMLQPSPMGKWRKPFTGRQDVEPGLLSEAGLRSLKGFTASPGRT
jgi:hypothetical protein